MPDLESLPESQQVAFTLIQALDALRDGLRPFVIGVLQEKEGPQWFAHPRVQRMVPVPPALEGEVSYGAEEPVLDLALLLKLVGADSYWYRTFRPRLPGISRWQIDSLRELRNRVAHNDGEDPLLTTPSLAVPYLTTMEQLLRVISSDKAVTITKVRSSLQRTRRQAITTMLLGRSRWSLLFWLSAVALAGATVWLIDYAQSPRLARSSLIVGTPDRRLERYLPLERYLESRLRPAALWRALRGEKIDVRIEGAESYPEAVSHLRARRWDVLLGFSPVVSMESLDAGYQAIGRMFPNEPDYHSLLFTRKGSALRTLEDIHSETRIALGDFFSATKYYVPMSMLQGRSARITLNLPTAEIAEQVRSGRADVGAMAGSLQRFQSLNPDFAILASSAKLPASVIALSPELNDLDRNRLQHALLDAPESVRGDSVANYGPGVKPDYRIFARHVAEGKAFSACLRNREGVFNLLCQGSDRIESEVGWIDDIAPEGTHIRVNMTTADQRRRTFLITRSLLEQTAIYKVLNELKGRELRVLALQQSTSSRPIFLETPHQLEIRH
ncbi:MAG: PhnD/SsuA/transferrin family substrate-binding protein [Cyanobium sp. CZS 25K]|nr:PhnD/SsuA/transferrin family substrate-binding protein [Cyanobium sp. CZS25K]